jgi:hypothetical protein
MKHFSLKTGLWTLVIYTIILSIFGIARGSASTSGFGERIILVALSGFLVGFFLDPIVRAVRGSFGKRFIIVAILIFSLACISNVLETILYLPAIVVAGSIGGGVIQTLILAAVLTYITKPAKISHPSKEIMLSFGKKVFFIVILALVWLPVYFLFVSLDTPIVHLFEKGSNDVFSHPTLVPMLTLEFVRGIVHAAVILSIASLAVGNKRVIWLWGALSIAILNGWLPILPVSTLPLGIRIANGFEITFSSITFAGIGAYFFAWLINRH